MSATLMTSLVLIALGLQGWLFARGLRSRGLCRLERLLGAWLLVWLALVLGGGLSAAFGKLGSASWYFAAIAALTGLLLASLAIRPGGGDVQPTAAPPLYPPWRPRSRWDRGIMLAALALFALGFILVTLIGWWHGPTLDDCLACKLPRAAFFTRTGSLLPPGGWSNPRIFGVPPYCSMLQLPFFVTGSDLASCNLLGSATWLLLAGAVYLAARFCRATPPAAITAAFLFSFSALILQKGSSENDDLLAALPTLLAAHFFVTACGTGRAIRGALAGVAFGLALGGKLISLYLAAPLGLLWLWRLVRGAGGRPSVPREALARVALSFAAAVILSGSVFFAQNWRMYRSPLPRTTMVEMNRNSPFHPGTFAYTLAGQSLTCLASCAVNAAAFLHWQGAINREALAGWIGAADRVLKNLLLDRIPHHTAPFGGEFSVAPFDAMRTFDPMRELNESNNSFGILGVTILGAALLAGRSVSPAAWIFAAVGLLAFVQHCATLKFILQTTRYLTPFVALGMPLVAAAADRCRPGASRWAARALFALAAAYTFAFIVPAWWHGRDRGIQRIAEQPGRAPLPMDSQTSPELRRRLSDLPVVNVMDSYELPFLPLLELRRGRSLVINDFSASRAPMFVGTFWNVDAVTAAGFGGMLWPVPVDFRRPGVTFMPIGAAPISHYFFQEHDREEGGGVALVRLAADRPAAGPIKVSVSIFSLPGGSTEDLEIAIGDAHADSSVLTWQPASRELRAEAAGDAPAVHLRSRLMPGRSFPARLPLREPFDPFFKGPS